MDLKCTLVAVGAAIAGATVQHVIAKYIWPNRHKTYNWIFTFRDHKKLGIPCKTDLILDRDGYSFGYSFEYKCSLWVSYIISEHSIGVDVERSDDFYADPDIPEKYRVQPDDFRNTGYDKGHLAPSASIDFSRKSNEQTFAMPNIALQHPRLNRQVWGSLEGLIREWTETSGKLAIITGPLFAKKPKLINDMPLPKGFYKIVYAFKHERAIGFIFPNEGIRASRLWDFVMSVKEIERETGYTFFPKLSEAKQERIKAERDVAWWKKMAK